MTSWFVFLWWGLVAWGGPAFSAGEKCIELLQPDHFVSIKSGDYRNPGWQTRAGSSPRIKPVFSPDERFLLFTTPDNVAVLWDVANGRPHAQLERAVGVSEASPQFSFDSKHLVGKNRDTRAISFWDVETGRMDRVVPIQSEGILKKFAPGGKYLLLHDEGRGAVKIVDTQTGKLFTIIYSDLGLDDISSDGQFYLGRNHHGQLHTVDLESKGIRIMNPPTMGPLSELDLPSRVAGPLTQLNFDPSGKRILLVNPEDKFAMSVESSKVDADDPDVGIYPLSVDWVGWAHPGLSLLRFDNAIVLVLNEPRGKIGVSQGIDIRRTQISPNGKQIFVSVARGGKDYHLVHDSKTLDPQFELKGQAPDIRLGPQKALVSYGDDHPLSVWKSLPPLSDDYAERSRAPEYNIDSSSGNVFWLVVENPDEGLRRVAIDVRSSLAGESAE